MVAFFVMAFAASLPNFFVDINAAFKKIPQLAFGEIIGGNLVDLTVVLALAALFSKKHLKAQSNMVQTSAIFTAAIVVLPLFLVLDGMLDRTDGSILILSFFVYAFWLFSEKDRFKKIYKEKNKKGEKGHSMFLKSAGKVIIILILLLATSWVIVDNAKIFSVKLGIPLSLVGILIVGLGNCFPEMYFSIVSARRGEGWMVLGDVMGSVIICSTLVLGVVALISPFEIYDFSPFLIARAFTLVASLVFIVSIKTGNMITKKEGLILLFIYIVFLITEIFKPYLLSV